MDQAMVSGPGPSHRVRVGLWHVARVPRGGPVPEFGSADRYRPDPADVSLVTSADVAENTFGRSGHTKTAQPTGIGR